MDRQPHPFFFFRGIRPLVPITIFFILGIVAASYWPLTDKLGIPLLMVPVFISIAGIRKKWRFNFIPICIIFFLLGVILSSQQIDPHPPRNHIKHIVEQTVTGFHNDDSLGMRLEGIVYNAPERFSDKTRLYIDAERVFTQNQSIPVTGKILITVGSPYVRVECGDRVRLIAKLRIPRNFGNPGEFDYAGGLAREGIYVIGHVENERWIAVLGQGQKQGLRTVIERLRDRLRNFIDNSGIENTAVIKALILGEKGEIPKTVRDSFSQTGTAHILAISGLHIGIIAFVSYWIILRLLKFSERIMLAFDIRKIAAFSSIIPVLFYGAIAGFSLSTQRAVIMVLVFILAVLMDREKGFYNTLAAAAFVILIISPLSIYDISFQLSFASVLAIVYLAPKFPKLWINDDEQTKNLAQLLPPHPARKPLQNYLLNPLAVSVAASLGTAPFIAWHFHRVSIVGVPANIVAVPLMGFIAVPLGLVSGLASFFYMPFANLILKFSDIVLKTSLWTVDLFARLVKLPFLVPDKS